MVTFRASAGSARARQVAPAKRAATLRTPIGYDPTRFMKDACSAFLVRPNEHKSHIRVAEKPQFVHWQLPSVRTGRRGTAPDPRPGRSDCRPPRSLRSRL